MEERHSGRTGAKTAALGSAGVQRRREGAQVLRTRQREALLKSKRRRTEDAAVAVELDDATVRRSVARLTGPPGADRLEALKTLRRGLSSSAPDAPEPPVAACVAAGLIPALGALLGAGQAAAPATPASAASMGPVWEEERLECLWILTNVAAGSHDDTMATLAVSPAVVGLLGSDSGLLAEHAAWAVGNIAGDSAEARAALARQGAVHPLCELIRSRHHATARTACWAVTNLMRGPGPAAPFVAAGAATAALRWLTGLVAAAEAEAAPGVAAAAPPAAAGGSGSGSLPPTLRRDDTLLAEAAWVLAYVTAKEEDFSHQLAAAGVLQAAVRALALPELVAAVTPCLRILGNVTALGDAYVETALGVRLSAPGGGSALLGALCRILAPQPEGEHWLAQLDGGGASGADDSGDAGMVDGGSDAGAATAAAADQANDASSAAAPTAATPPPLLPTRTIAPAAGAGSSSDSGAFTAAVHYTHGHVQEALWVASNVAGSTPAAAATLLMFPPPPVTAAASTATATGGIQLAPARCDTAGDAPPPLLRARQACAVAPPGVAPALSPAAATAPLTPLAAPEPASAGLRLGLLPLLVHHASGVWQVRRQAAHALLNLAAQRAVVAVPGTASGDASSVASHPFLPAVLAFPDVLHRAGVGLLGAPDLDAAGVGLALLETAVHAWPPPHLQRRGAGASDGAGRVAALIAQRTRALPPAAALDLAAVAASGVCGPAPCADWLRLLPLGDAASAAVGAGALTGGGRLPSGVSLALEADAPVALEALHYRYQLSEDAAAAALSARAQDLCDDFFFDDGEALGDGEDVGGQGGAGDGAAFSGLARHISDGGVEAGAAGFGFTAPPPGALSAMLQAPGALAFGGAAR